MKLMDCIRLNGLGYKYIKRDIDGNNENICTALKNINLDIKKGEFVAVLGRNGSGKSTFAKHLNAILMPAEGSVCVDGLYSNDEEKKYDIRRKTGMVFQNPDNQLVASVVCEEVAFGPENLGLDSDIIIDRVNNALISVNMNDYADSDVHTLYGGQKQRIAIAGVLAMESDYMILDEPTAMLDPKGRKEVMETVARLNKEKNMTIILITHNVEEAEYADRIIILDKGCVCVDDIPQKIFSDTSLMKKMCIKPPFSVDILGALNIETLYRRMNEKELAFYIRDLFLERCIFPEKLKYKAVEKQTKIKNIPDGAEGFIRLQNVGYIYNPGTVYEKRALSGIDLTIRKGECVGIVGNTGSGKTTLTQILNGLLVPSYGNVYCDDKMVDYKKKEEKLLRKKVGMVFQYPEHQIVRETVYEDVMFGPLNMGINKKECERYSVNALNTVGISEKMWNRYIYSMSGGEKKRVSIAGVLAMRPEYIVLDEPTAGLDMEGKMLIFNELKRLCSEEKVGIIFVSHSMEDIAEYADRMLVLNQGKLLYDGIPSEYFNKFSEDDKSDIEVPQVVKLVKEMTELGFPKCTNIINKKMLVELLRQWLDSREHEI